MLRDLEKPEVPNLSLVQPDLSRYHNNSTLMSSLFLRIDQAFGKGTSLSLINYLEENPGQTTVVKSNSTEDFQENLKTLESFMTRSIGLNSSGGWKEAFKIVFLPRFLQKGNNISGAYDVLLRASTGSSREEPKAIMVNPTNIPEVGVALRQSFLDLGTLIRRWGKEKNIPAEDLEKLLKEKQI